MRLRRMWLPLGLSCAVVASTTLMARQLPASDRPAWTAPSAVDARLNPLTSRADTLAGASRVFRERCSQCHGADGTGTSMGPGLTGRRSQSQTDGALFWKITSGNTRSGMPTFSYMPELQRWQLVLHLRALGSSHTPRSSSR